MAAPSMAKMAISENGANVINLWQATMYASSMAYQAASKQWQRKSENCWYGSSNAAAKRRWRKINGSNNNIKA